MNIPFRLTRRQFALLFTFLAFVCLMTATFILVLSARQTSRPAQPPTTDRVSYKNPIIDANAADPSIVRDDNGRFYIYASGGRSLPKGDAFGRWTSTDLVDWDYSSIAWTQKSPNLNGLKWGPSVSKTGGHFTMVYVTGGERRQIEYATGPTAAGPFAYRGVLVASGEYVQPGTGGTIGPQIFAEGDDAYLVFGGGALRIIKLTVNSDGTITKGQASDVLIRRDRRGTVEGAWLTKHDEYYYLYFAHGVWRCQKSPCMNDNGTKAAEYETAAMRSKDIMGPYSSGKDSGYRIILSGKDPFRGPGGNTTFSDDDGQEWMIYHAWHKGKRVVMMDKITYEDEWPVIGDGYPSSRTVSDGPVLRAR